MTDVEKLSAELHAIYQKEAKRQAGTGEDEVRHPDDYNSLPEHTKEYDRVLARYVITLLVQERRAVIEAIAKEKIIPMKRQWNSLDYEKGQKFMRTKILTHLDKETDAKS